MWLWLSQDASYGECSLHVKEPRQAHGSECLGPGLWHCLGRLLNPWTVASGWRKWVAAGSLCNLGSPLVWSLIFCEHQPQLPATSLLNTMDRTLKMGAILSPASPKLVLASSKVTVPHVIRIASSVFYGALAKNWWVFWHYKGDD